jgi:outer membrane receptor for monomeric catechols
LLAGAVITMWTPLGQAAGDREQGTANEPEEVQKLKEVTVKEKAGAPGLEVSPSKTVIEVDKFSTIGVPNSVLDVLKTQVAIDFRGETDLDSGIDSVYMRGFDARAS